MTRFLYITLAFFFGIFGMHNFVAGFTKKGTIQFLVTLLSFGLLSIFVFMYNLHEMATVEHDYDGDPFM